MILKNGIGTVGYNMSFSHLYPLVPLSLPGDNHYYQFLIYSSYCYYFQELK